MLFQHYKYILFITLVTLVMSCTPKNGRQQTETSKEVSAVKNNDVQLSPQQMNTVGIETGPLEERNLKAVVKASGQLAVPPQNKADVSVLSGGIIRNIQVLEGQQVKKGQVLATVENQELIRIQQDYLSAKNSFSYVEAEYERQTQLNAAGAGTGKAYQSAKATAQAEHSRIRAYESQLKQLGIDPAQISSGKIVSHFPMKSPIKGTVGQITANLGAYVQPGVSIMEIVDNSKIHCDLVVFEKDLMKVKTGQRVNFQLTNQENEKISGKISGINKSFENESKGVIVHAVIENTTKQNLIPGMYVTALISIGTKLSQTVPIDAVIRSEGREYIYILIKKGGNILHFKKSEVRTGISELGYIEITAVEKLPPAVTLVTKGAFYLQSRSTGSSGED